MTRAHQYVSLLAVMIVGACAEKKAQAAPYDSTAAEVPDRQRDTSRPRSPNDSGRVARDSLPFRNGP
jgi:hypothetical protein